MFYDGGVKTPPLEAKLFYDLSKFYLNICLQNEGYYVII